MLGPVPAPAAPAACDSGGSGVRQLAPAACDSGGSGVRQLAAASGS
jgi:hypothetical protein